MFVVLFDHGSPWLPSVTPGVCRSNATTEANQITEVVPNYCDAISGQCYGKYLQGWSSPHLLSENGVQAWSTAQTLHCVSKMATVVKAIMHDDVLLEFNGVKLEGCPKADAWNRLLDTDLGDPSKEETCRTLKSVIKERVLMPLSGDTVTTIYGTAYSTILFGPPGTAKTTICEAVANYLVSSFYIYLFSSRNEGLFMNSLF